jgi:predicted ABC-type ATPase
MFCWLPSPEMSIQRVAHRVRSGGHFVPDDTVRRRYDAGLRNFFQLYRPIAQKWHFFETTTDPRLIAEQGGQLSIRDEALWSRLEDEYGRKR